MDNLIIIFWILQISWFHLFYAMRLRKIPTKSTSTSLSKSLKATAGALANFLTHSFTGYPSTFHQRKAEGLISPCCTWHLNFASNLGCNSNLLIKLKLNFLPIQFILKKQSQNAFSSRTWRFPHYALRNVLFVNFSCARNLWLLINWYVEYKLHWRNMPSQYW